MRTIQKYNLEVSDEKTKIIELKKDDDDDGYGDHTFDFWALPITWGKTGPERKESKGKQARRSTEQVYSGVKNG